MQKSKRMMSSHELRSTLMEKRVGTICINDDTIV